MSKIEGGTLYAAKGKAKKQDPMEVAGAIHDVMLARKDVLEKPKDRLALERLIIAITGASALGLAPYIIAMIAIGE